MFKIIIILALMFSFAKPSFAQNDTIYIVTSALCDQCKSTIENYLSFEKGIKKSTLDIDSKILTVIYNTEKTSPDKIRVAVTKSGYDADEMKADEKTFRKLPDCCKDPNHKMHNE